MSYNPKVKFSTGRVQVIEYAPVAAASAGDVLVVNGVAYFAIADIAAGAVGEWAIFGGVWGGNKAAGTWLASDRIYYNATGNPNVGTAGTGAFNNTGTGTFVGYAVVSPETQAEAATGDQLGYFVFSGTASSGLRVVSGQLTTVTAADTVVTGLQKVVSVVAVLDDNPGDNPEWVSATIGDQAGTPAAGSVILKTWQNTAGNDPTPTAATTFGKKVNWIATGY